MKLAELDAITITRPVERKDCIIEADTLPPSDETIVAAGTACLCARHEASLRERVRGGPTTMGDVLGMLFGPIV